MVAYGFKKQFVDPITKGTKSQTIRANGKRRHARVGELVQLYYAMRTKQCSKILKDDPVCTLSVSITIGVGKESINYIRVGHGLIEDLESFAQSDGFDSLAAMHAYWLESHGVGMFEGTLIGWEPNVTERCCDSQVQAATSKGFKPWCPVHGGKS